LGEGEGKKEKLEKEGEKRKRRKFCGTLDSPPPFYSQKDRREKR